MDCAGEEGGLGCVGGFAYNGFDYAKAVGGVEAEDSYPYEDDDNKCRFDVTKALAKVTGYTNITSKDENALQQAVATIGPITVAIDSSHPSFQLYKSGSMYLLFFIVSSSTIIQIYPFSLSSTILLRKSA